MIAELSCGGGSVQPPGATATSAMAREGLATASCAVATVAMVTRSIPTTNSPTSFRRLITCLLHRERRGSDGDRLTSPVDQLFERLADVADGDDLAAGGRLVAGDVALGHEDAREAHLRRFAHAQRRLRGAADLAREADLAEDSGAGANRPIAQARGDGADDGEIRGGLVDGHPSGHVDEDVLPLQVEAGAFFQHREQQ